MGLYINPIDMTKETFLRTYGVKSISQQSFRDIVTGADKSVIPAILVDNGPFRACAVVFSERELEACTLATDLRPKSYWVIRRKTVEEHCPDLVEALKRYYDKEV